MANIGCARRTVLRLLLGCAAFGLPASAGATHPPGRGPLWARLPAERRRLRYRPMIVVDPGHGGIDPGAIGAGDVYEKIITYATARQLMRDLVATGRFRAALTRGADEFVPLRERVARAGALHADLFLSVHADALPNAAMRGLSVFTLSAEASDREAAALAESENRDVVHGVHFSREPRVIGEILAELTRDQTDNQSIELAGDIVAALGHQVMLLENPQRAADFAVLTAPDIPSALVELGCLSNPAEEKLLLQPQYQRRLARGLTQAIEAYFAARRRG
ncbi:MAG TPA: N-acetylmuramoyl-L-alanine amidase [Stellaceae bacterium]|jgi:N-acetylmuramoyl-L-alanine amidase